MPRWLSRRDPAALPPMFVTLTQEDALAVVRGRGALERVVKGGSTKSEHSQVPQVPARRAKA
jgi:hypothetical protein